MKMTFYTANCRGNAKNSLYPNRRVIDNEDDCMEVVAFDHVPNSRTAAGAGITSSPAMWT